MNWEYTTCVEIVKNSVRIGMKNTAVTLKQILKDKLWEQPELSEEAVVLMKQKIAEFHSVRTLPQNTREDHQALDWLYKTSLLLSFFPINPKQI